MREISKGAVHLVYDDEGKEIGRIQVKRRWGRMEAITTDMDGRSVIGYQPDWLRAGGKP